MANVIGVNVYAYNFTDPIPGGSVRRGISVAGLQLIPLTNQVIGGVQVYSLIQLPKTAVNDFESRYYVVETVQQLIAITG